MRLQASIQNPCLIHSDIQMDDTGQGSLPFVGTKGWRVYPLGLISELVEQNTL